MVPPAPEPERPDIRTALRRGGVGGGGAAGTGTLDRGGIEGDPVPLETRDPRYHDYFDRIRRMIQAKWGYPCADGVPLARECVRREGQLVIEFGIAKDGGVPFIQLLRSSGSANMDDFAMNAVRLASPFPPVPDSIGRKGLPVLATFRYVIRDDLVNILR